MAVSHSTRLDALKISIEGYHKERSVELSQYHNFPREKGSIKNVVLHNAPEM